MILPQGLPLLRFCYQGVATAVWQASPAAAAAAAAAALVLTSTSTSTADVAATVSTFSSSCSTTPTTSLVHCLTFHSLTSILMLSGGSSIGSGSGSVGSGGNPLDIGRFKLRLEGLHTYAVITTLLMNASLRLFSSTPKHFQDGERVRNAMKIVFSLMVTVSILMGSYTTIVFSLLELYAKRALGRNLDQQVWIFFQQTQPVYENQRTILGSFR